MKTMTKSYVAFNGVDITDGVTKITLDRGSDSSDFASPSRRGYPRATFDSTGRPISEGCKVRFRGQIYTIRSFGFENGVKEPATIKFEEAQHEDEVATESTVCLVNPS